jgi:uroporphyrinogen-III decarboxylase
MNSRERFLAVLAGKMPDRVPVTAYIQDQGHFLSQCYPTLDPWDHTANQLKVIELQKQLGMDVFVRCWINVKGPFPGAIAGLNISQQTGDWHVETTETRTDSARVLRSTIRTPGGVLTQEFTIQEINDRTYVYACTRKPVRSPADLELVEAYEPKITEEWRGLVRERIRPVRAALGDSGLLAGWAPGGVFNNAAQIIDLEQLYALFRTDYDFYARLMRFSLERMLPYALAQVDAGVDAVVFSGNVAGGFVGRKNFDRFVLPFEREYISRVQARGAPVLYHNCGQIMALLESYKEMGAAMVEPFSPPPTLGDADLALAKQTVAGAYVMLGGLDHVNVLQNGTREDVRRATAAAMRAGKPGGKFILEPADFLEYGTPVENVRAYVETALQEGQYA